jgi:F1F0 ATPase subunit 2
MTATLALAWLTLGLLLGAAYFLSLRWNVGLFSTGQSLALALGVQLARFAILAGALAIVAIRSGTLGLLAATLGVLAARLVAVRIEGRG